MKRILNLAILISLLAGASLISCADSESRSALAGDATVIINLGLPTDDETASISIIDRVLRFFTSEAVAAPAPAVFSTISIRVTGDGIGSIAKDFPPTSIISMTVPGGGLRTFVVTAYVADTSAVLTYQGTSIANVPSGGSVSVPVLMTVHETKLVIPDYYNQRLVMMSGVGGLNKVIRDTTQIFGGARSVYPYDVDVDKQRRIYFSDSNALTTTHRGIYRMDNMNSTFADETCVQLVSNTSGVSFIAIDRVRNLLYYIVKSSFYNVVQYNLNTDLTQTLITGESTLKPRILCVDEASGNLYIGYSMTMGTEVYMIGRFNPVTLSWIGSYYNPSVMPFDIVFKEGHLYVSYQLAANITELSPDLTSVIDTLPGDPVNTDPFIGPKLFIALTNRKLFVLDESFGLDIDDRVVSFDDIDGSGWETSETPGTFKFYYTC